ncbi:C-type lectin 37Db-like [Sitophilus oryzae]|uniref:C-type lectin 37Db-like n=1 Tax=Sitophilus oryzae TaxID=7048 RepID=A0A6J2YGZ1_SITOR|nr:C-type lectin 37Db-like [Sitophilus oryzae]
MLGSYLDVTKPLVFFVAFFITEGFGEWCELTIECREHIPCINKITYVVSRNKVNFSGAMAKCKEMGMELASIMSATEQRVITDHIKQEGVNVVAGDPYKGFWLSGTRSSRGGNNFVWLGTGKQMTYKNFAPGQPDNAGNNEDCVELWYGSNLKFYWNDIGCYHNLRYICQKTQKQCLDLKCQ